ncbi:MAG: hypothetical protein K6G12_03770 [Lachnospiraceae bacterium]|nr:hypothetical protein [Lachnospiraceae bacterium]
MAVKKEKKVLTETQKERRKERIDTLKSMIFPCILLGIIAIGIAVIVNFQNKPAEEEIIPVRAYSGDESAIVLENDALTFTMDPTTTQFEVNVKSSGRTWYSNPQGIDEDPIALAEEKKRLKSTLLMSYAVVNGLETNFNNYAYSAENGTYEITASDDEVRVDYSIGEVEKEYVIPPVMTVDAYEEWQSKLNRDGAHLVEQYYKKYDLNKLGKKDNADELIANYPIIQDGPIYALRDNTKENNKARMQEYFAEAGYTYEDYLEDKELTSGESSSDKPVFNVSMIYKLDGDDLVVEIPMGDIEYKSDTPIYTLTVLPFFGAGGSEDEGYMLVPEGGGSIINFNNGKVSQSNYYANVYGWDLGISREAVIHNTRAYFGAFGISNGSDSFVCSLDEGSAYASVQADISGKVNSYNCVNAVYSMCSREKYDVSALTATDVYEYLWELPDETISQRYSFVDSDSYVDMAKDYGDNLKAKYGDYLSADGSDSVPAAIEIVGSIDKVKQIVGVPVSRPLKLTSYNEAASIVSDLSDSGISNMHVKISGWMNGGVNQQLIKKIRTISDLGSKKDLKNMVAQCQDAGADVYLNGYTLYAFDSNIFDGFFSYRDAARLISKERAQLYQYSHVTYAAREYADPYWLLHASLSQKMADNLVKETDSYGSGVSFEDIGMDLAADYYRKNFTTRQMALHNQSDELKKLCDEGKPVMINMGNDYAVPYADMVVNTDLRGSEYTICDATVPFWELAMHGLVNYAGESINICGNAEEELLDSVAYGAGLQFTFMQASPFVTQKTLYPEYYGANFDSWRDKAIEMYTRYNNELGHTFNQEMTGYENLTDTLCVTEYADGTRVYVNYAYEDADADGVTVPARDYLTVR